MFSFLDALAYKKIGNGTKTTLQKQHQLKCWVNALDDIYFFAGCDVLEATMLPYFTSCFALVRLAERERLTVTAFLHLSLWDQHSIVKNQNFDLHIATCPFQHDLLLNKLTMSVDMLVLLPTTEKNSEKCCGQD